MNNITENKKYTIQSPLRFFNKKKIPDDFYWKNTLYWQNQQNIQQNKNEKNLLNLGLPTILIIGACLISSKGFQKNINNTLEKIKNQLEYKLEINSLKEKGKIFKFFEKCSRVLTSIIKKSESINNITSLKDILFMKLMYKTKITKSIHKGISNFFDKLSRKTVAKSYDKTKKALEIMEAKFQMLDDYILKTCGDEIITHDKQEIPVKKLIEAAKEIRKDIHLFVGPFISPKFQDIRRSYIKKATSKLYQTFWDASFKDFVSVNNKFKNKEMWQTFIAAEQIKKHKSRLADAAAKTQKLLSCNDKDSSLEISQLLSDLKKLIPSFDTEGYEQVKKLEWLAKNGDALKSHKEMFLKELNKLSKTHSKDIAPDIIQQAQEYKNSYISLITNLMNENDLGEIQKLISIYYKIRPFEFAKSGALQAAKNAVQSFNKSANLEISEYFDKVRDLELGSAPTDVLTILLSTGLISHDLLKAKNNNQKTTVMLTSGIPLAGAIATTVISASKLVSGGKSLALGVASGICLNFIGKFVDNFRIKHFKKTK